MAGFRTSVDYWETALHYGWWEYIFMRKPGIPVGKSNGFRLEPSENIGCYLRRCYFSYTWFSLFSCFGFTVADLSLNKSNFMVSCLCTRFSPGWFVLNGKHLWTAFWTCGVDTKSRSRATTIGGSFRRTQATELYWVYNSGSDYKHNNMSEVLCYKVGNSVHGKSSRLVEMGPECE